MRFINDHRDLMLNTEGGTKTASLLKIINPVIKAVIQNLFIFYQV